ncbi:MAG: M23 family metallopeptidase [Ruthenibacterium sp.]
MIFQGRNRVRYPYACFGWTRGGGKIWHGGIDIEGIDDKIIRAATNGKVLFAGIITNRSNLTWEWGWYVKIATGDGRYWDYYCHCRQLLVKAGQSVKAGDAIAIMGNSGNARYASPPYEHVHFERRRAGTTVGIDPGAAAGIANAVGIYGTVPAKGEPKANVLRALYNINVRSAPGTQYAALGKMKAGDTAQSYEKDGAWQRIAGGWVHAADYMEET